MAQYKLEDLVHDDHVLVEIRKGMYGLSQAGKIAHDRLVKHIKKDGYVPCKHTPGLFTHIERPIFFSLVVDDFLIKYVGKEHADHLLATLRKLYVVKVDWKAELFLGISMEWDYDKRTVDLSMPNYIEQALIKYTEGEARAKQQDSPHKHQTPNYGAKVQYTVDADTSPPLNASAIHCL